MEKIRIGTRGSRLALWQAHHIADLLNKGGLDTEIVTIVTTGDKILDVSIAKIGSKGVFTEEIEEQLAAGNIDIAVHSAKDMQSVLPVGFELIAFTDREEVNDIVLSDKEGLSLDQNIIIGTSSTRRIAFLKHYYPHIQTVPVRGNLQTRIGKMKEGVCDALLLAYAGVHRMGYGDMMVNKLDATKFIPAVGQGSIAIECAASLSKDKKQNVRLLTNHLESETRLLAERAYLRELEGGCSIPVFALAHVIDGNVSITGGIVSLDGSNKIIHTTHSERNHPEKSGQDLAEYILGNGGKEILDEIKKQINK